MNRTSSEHHLHYFNITMKALQEKSLETEEECKLLKYYPKIKQLLTKNKAITYLNLQFPLQLLYLGPGS